MSDTLGNMIAEHKKRWTRKEVLELIALADRKGIDRTELANVHLGVHWTTLAFWISESKKSYRPPTEVHRRVLSCVEEKISRRKDKEVAG